MIVNANVEDQFPLHFATSGIRGKSNSEISPMLMLRLANATSFWMKFNYPNERILTYVGYDNRRNSYSLAHTFAAGLNSFGIDVKLSNSEVSTPMLIHATVNSPAKFGVMITGSHLPAEDNGFILFNHQGDYYTGLMIEPEPEYVDWEQLGTLSFFEDEIEEYKQFLFDLSNEFGLDKLPLKIMLDPVHGVMKPYLEFILDPLVDELLKINWDYDDRFPGRTSEPNVENLQKTRDYFLSLQCDLGIATDMDGDRVIFISKSGQIVSGDYIGAIFASRLWKSDPSAIVVAPINTSAVIELVADKYNGDLRFCKVGPPNIINLMRETEAKLGFEETGKYFFPEIAVWPDSAITIIKLLDLLRTERTSLDRLLEELPKLYASKSKLPMSRKYSDEVLNELKDVILTNFNDVESINEMDGLKISFGDKSWLLLRPSGTEDYIRIFSESNTKEKNQKLNQQGIDLIKNILAKLQ